MLLLVLWMLGFLADLGAAGGAVSNDTVGDLLRWLSSAEHFERHGDGTRRHAGPGVLRGSDGDAFLVLTKMAVESVRWR